MININNINYSLEFDSLWVNINLYSSDTQKEYTHLTVSLIGEEEQTISIDEKLQLGDNDIELVFHITYKTWFPQGMGPSDVYEIFAQAHFNTEISEYSSFITFSNLTYENNQLYIDNYNPQYFGVSLNIVGLPQIELAESVGINTIFSSDRRKEVVDYCNIKGIALLPYEAPTCSYEKIIEYRMNNKPIILEFNDLQEIKDELTPIYVGENFVSNNTYNHFVPILSIGTLNPLTNEINIEREEEIRLFEFSTYEFENNIIPKDNEIMFINLWLNKNIIAKRIIQGKSVKYKKSNVLVSRFQTEKHTWRVLFSSTEFINNLEIITENEINKNNFSIFPGETVQVTFRNIVNEPEFELKTL